MQPRLIFVVGLAAAFHGFDADEDALVIPPTPSMA